MSTRDGAIGLSPRRQPGSMWLLALLAAATAALAQDAAAPRAWLDRDRIEFGETVTLNLEVAGAAAEPDFSPLQRDFEIRGRSSSSETRIAGGRSEQRGLWAVALEPRRPGTLEIPPLRVGTQRTAPLRLIVNPARQGSASAGDPLFLEAEVDTPAPYVGQAVVYTVRLYYALNLLEGQLESAPPNSGELRQLGADRSEIRERDGRRYNVVARRYVLLPRRSGELALPPARFRGRALGDGRRGAWLGADAVSAVGPALTLQVRPQPASASPWLPADRLEMRLEAGAAPARQGEPITLTLIVNAVGVVPEQLPDMPQPVLPADRAQIFPETPETRDLVQDGRPAVERRQRIVLVPLGAGELEVPALELPWWDIKADRARIARSQPLRIAVQPAAAPPPTPAATGPAPAASEGAPAGDASAVPAPGGGPWPWIAALLALGWGLHAAWLWRRRPGPERDESAPARRGDPASLRRALAAGDLAAIEIALRACAPVAADPAGMSASLADPEQCRAVALLEAARWGGGDPGQAREALRRAFRSGPRFVAVASGAADDEVLPLLYPRR